MSRSVEVRQFLLHCEDTGTTNVPSQRTSSADASRISDDQVRRARLAVARSASDVDDCAALLDMLGLISDDDGQSPVQR